MKPSQLGGRPRLKYISAAVAVIIHGNSHVAGSGASGAPQRWTSVLAGLSCLSGSGITPTVSGVAGQTVSVTNIYDGAKPKMLTTAAAAVDANLVAGKVNVLIAMEFTNELQSNGGNVAAAHAQWVVYCAARRAAAASAGKQLRIVTVAPPPGAYQPPGQSEVNLQVAAQYAACQYLRGHWREHSDALCDLSMIPALAALYAGGDYSTAAFDATGLYSGDRMHFVDAGHALIAAAVNAAMRTVPA